MSDLPKAIKSETLSIMGADLKVHVLDNGQRIIDADSLAELFEAMASSIPMSDDDAMKLAKVIRP